MALAKGKINPLNVIGVRKLSYIPSHFAKLSVVLANPYDLERISLWIYQNLNSRYCVRTDQGLDAERRIIDICDIGIEDHRELTMFNLACPYLYNK